jgi:capsular polysaccharide biosynthesis protein
MEKMNGIFLDDEIDLRKLLTQLYKHWLLILVLMIMGGIITGLVVFLKKPAYTATAYLSIENTIVNYGVNVDNFLLSDDVTSTVAERLGLAVKDLPDHYIWFSKNDKQLHYIAVTSPDPLYSVTVANIWAEVSIEKIKNNLISFNEELVQAQADITTAESTLFQYLQNRGWSDLTWVDLIATGVENPTGVTIFDANHILPLIPLNQKTELTQLVREVSDANSVYKTIKQNTFDETYAVDKKVYLLNRAKEDAVDGPVLLNSLLLILAGAFAGLVIGCVWVLVSDWWKKKRV